MILIEEIASRRDNKGILRRWGKFYCGYCKSEVEKLLDNGLKQESCGCMQHELQAQAIKGKKYTEERNKKISNALKGREFSEEHIKNLSESQKGKKVSEETRQKISEKNKGRILNTISRKRIGEASKKRWENPEYIKIMKLGGIKGYLNSRQKPNKAELYLQYIINSLFFENQFQINVLGNFIVGGKCPDFIDPINNKIIELYGDYWHKGQDPNDRINYFNGYGYNTLVIWESELKDINNLKKKLVSFI